MFLGQILIREGTNKMKQVVKFIQNMNLSSSPLKIKHERVGRLSGVF